MIAAREEAQLSERLDDEADDIVPSLDLVVDEVDLEESFESVPNSTLPRAYTEIKQRIVTKDRRWQTLRAVQLMIGGVLEGETPTARSADLALAFKLAQRINKRRID